MLAFVIVSVLCFVCCVCSRGVHVCSHRRNMHRKHLIKYKYNKPAFVSFKNGDSFDGLNLTQVKVLRSVFYAFKNDVSFDGL